MDIKTILICGNIYIQLNVEILKEADLYIYIFLYTTIIYIKEHYNFDRDR
jgi:hypothetical protein